MKKILTRIASIVLVFTLVLSFAAINAGAYRIGDVINYAQPTNIVASINGYQIMSYNVDGLTYICVEDLRHYGFDVYYDNYTRSLTVNRNYALSIAPHISDSTNFWKIGSNKTFKNILYTDIVTFVNGSYVNSYNIDGRTIICFNDLATFGTVNYDNNKREISLYIDSMQYNPVATIVDLTSAQEIAAMAPQIDSQAKKAYGNHVTANLIMRAKGNVIVYEMYLNGVVLNSYQKRGEQQALEITAPDIKANYSIIKQYCPELAGVALILYDGSGAEVASKTIHLD